MTVSELAEYINKNGVKEEIIEKLKGKAKENKIQDDAHQNQTEEAKKGIINNLR